MAAAAAGPLRCPRCESANTKFCYYNNYSLSQPRHFCKACKRYWTLGGTLRNVPVGGGCRKNKRVKKHHPSAPAPAGPAAARPAQQPDLSSLFYNGASCMNLGSIGGLISNSNPSSSQQQPLSSYFDGDYSSLLASSIEHHRALMPCDGLQQANLGFLKDVKVEGDYSLMCSGGNFGADQWGANDYAFDAITGGDASCLEFWNPAMGGGGGWPDAANASLAPLI